METRVHPPSHVHLLSINASVADGNDLSGTIQAEICKWCLVFYASLSKPGSLLVASSLGRSDLNVTYCFVHGHDDEKSQDTVHIFFYNLGIVPIYLVESKVFLRSADFGPPHQLCPVEVAASRF